MQNKTNTTTNTQTQEQTTEELYNILFYHTSRALRSLNAVSFSPMLTQLINQQYNDKKAIKSPTIAVKLSELSEDLTEVNTELIELERHIKRITLVEDTREELNERRNALALEKAQITEDKKTLNDKKVTALTFSDFMDCVQECALAYFSPIDPKYIDKAEKRLNGTEDEDQEEDTEEEDQESTQDEDENTFNSMSVEDLARLYQCRSAVKKYINSRRAPQVYNGTRTRYIKLSAEDLAEIENGTLKEGDTVRLTETKQKTLVIKNNEYKWKTQEKTITNCHSLEHYTTEDGETYIDGYIKSYNMYADTIGALEHIETLINNAALTERERLFLKYFCNKTAIMVETKAHIHYFNMYYDKAVKNGQLKQFFEYANKYAYIKRIDYALYSIGIEYKDPKKYTSVKNKFMTRLRARIQKAYKKTHQEHTTIIKTDFEYYNHLMTTNRGIRPSTTATSTNLLSFVDLEHKHTPSTDNTLYTYTYTDKHGNTHTEGATWSTTNQEHKPITDQDRAQDQERAQTERERRKIYGYKLELYKALRDAEPMKEKTYNAKYSAFIFFDALTESEQIEVATARIEELKAYEERKKALEKKKTTFEEWRKLHKA